ncbi:hypothetical protein GQX74_009744 [Glossina fuscipes]|nr:hypothetical protein GQX74_009744 [Glossina fuscipes]
MKSNREGEETQPQLHTHAVLSYSTGVEILGYRLREVCTEIFDFTCFTRAVGLKNVAIRWGLTWYEPSFNPAHASQTGDESLATRLDPVFQRFKLRRSYTTAEYPADRSAAPLFESLSRKLTHLFKMSDDETPNIAHNASGNIADNGCSGHRQPGPAGETASPDLELASMLKQQREMLLICVQEIGNLKQEKSAATQRTQLRDSEGTRNFLMAASTSTPQQRMPSQTVAHPSGSHQHDQQAGQQRTSDENARRRDIDLNRWHVKFDGSGKGLTVESFLFRAERLRQQQQISSQHSTRRPSRPHPPATTVTTNQHLHQSQKQQQLEHSTPNRHPHQHHHHRHSVQDQQKLPSTTQPAGNNTTDRNFGTDATVTATAQHSKSCFQPAPQTYTNQIPANLASNGRSTMINSEFEFSTNTGGGSSNDGSSSRTPFDLATEALRDSRPIDRERVPNL